MTDTNINRNGLPMPSNVVNNKITATHTYYPIILMTAFMLSACSGSLERQSSYESSRHLATPVSSAMLNDLQGELVQHPQKTGVFPLIDGENAFAARMNVINQATSSIDLQYYIYRSDDTGNMMTWALLKAAERGVRVRMLLDDTTSRHVDPNIIALAHHENINIRLYNSVKNHNLAVFDWLFDFSNLNYRMHSKSLTVDNSVSIVGGRNIGDEYFSADKQFGFGDFDLLTVGPTVSEVSVQFDEYWQSPIAIPLEQLMGEYLTDKNFESESERLETLQQNYSNDPYYQRIVNNSLYTSMKFKGLRWYWGEASLLYDPPDKAKDKKENLLISKIMDRFAAAKKRILIVSPYFVPTSEGADALVELQKKGIEVTIITNSLAATDVVAVHSRYRVYRKKLLEAGVKLYEVKVEANVKMPTWSTTSRTSLHAKTFLIDDDKIFVGSFNFDPRSAWINTEMGIFLHQKMFVYDVRTYLNSILPTSAYRVSLDDGRIVWIDDSTNEVLTEEPGADLSRRINADVISILPIESQL